MADRAPQTPLGLFGTDALIDAEDRAIRDTVRAVLTAKVRPHIGEWFESTTPTTGIPSLLASAMAILW